MKILTLGDPHVRPSNLEESENLLVLIKRTAHEKQVDRIEILGDLFHSHSLIQLKVLHFWDLWLETLSQSFEVVVLTGNHDMDGDFNSSANSLSIFKRIDSPRLHIVDRPKQIGLYGYLPYFHRENEFLDQANVMAGNGVKTLVCHQTIDGSSFDNGMYAPGGMDSSKISDSVISIISGHIHAEQRFGRVWYPGTSRWDTVSDANRRKGFWILTHDDKTSEITESEFVSAETVCVPLIEIQWVEGDQVPTIQAGSRTSVEMVGSSDWIQKNKTALQGLASIKTKITDTKKARVRTGSRDLGNFVDNIFKPVTGVKKERIQKYLKEFDLV